MRPANGPLVTATDARAAATRAEAGRWAYVRQAWQEDGGQHRTGHDGPDRYYWPRESLLAGVKACRLAPLPGYDGPPKVKNGPVGE